MIFELLKLCTERGASDLHFKVGYPPILRVDGSMLPLKMKEIDHADYENMLEAILDDYQLVKFIEHRKLDLGYSFANARFRVNLFHDYNGGSAVFRVIPFLQLTFDDIGLPKAARAMIERPFGLILVTGATGAGKSTTLSTFITHIVAHKIKSVVTIEDPIEYIFGDGIGLVSQRQVGVDCRSFDEGIRGAMQTDADVIMVGELRDPEAVNMTLTAAESGKLVFATLHSNTAMQAIDRFVNLFPQTQHAQVLGRLSTTLIGIITQTLIPRKIGKGRVAAFEILMGLQMIRSLIAESRIHLIQSYQESGGDSGMCTLDQALAQLVISEKISMTEALMRAGNPSVVRKIVEQAGITVTPEGPAQ
ncbi:MAG TPA: PilT/PilU family type 4a pilus ATPase [Candidatus Ozemobacteraceae bacterium]|nr:PilT/PilU family type 4a pilus ATPase [Candidatus Ozemobacteraceae bacterium]